MYQLWRYNHTLVLKRVVSIPDILLYAFFLGHFLYILISCGIYKSMKDKVYLCLRFYFHSQPAFIPFFNNSPYDIHPLRIHPRRLLGITHPRLEILIGIIPYKKIIACTHILKFPALICNSVFRKQYLQCG